MVETIIGLALFGILAVISWYVDGVTKQDRRGKDYYDG